MFMLTLNENEDGTLAINTTATNEAVQDFFEYTDYPPLSDVKKNNTYDVLVDPDSPLYFNPANCALKRSYAIPEVASTIIGVVGNKGDPLKVT